MKMTGTNKTGFVVTFYKSTPESETLLKNLLSVMRKQDEYHLVLATHSTVSEEIQNMCDYVIYEKFNYCLHDKPFSWGIAELSLINKAFEYLFTTVAITHAYKVSYDVVINDVSYFKKWPPIWPEEKSYVSCQWGHIPFCTHSFYATTGFIYSQFPKWKRYEDMIKYGATLEEALYNYITNIENSGDRLKNYGSQKEFYGPNKMDVIGFEMQNIDFTFTPEDDLKFWITNRTGRDLNGSLKIIDYYSDTALDYHKEFPITNGAQWWIVVPYKEYSYLSKNGYVLEYVTKDGFTIRKNFGIKNPYLKHPMAKRFAAIDQGDQAKFNEFHSFDNWEMYKPLNIPMDEIKTFVDVGANWGLSAFTFMQSGAKCILIDADETNIKILNDGFGDMSNVEIIHRAVYKEDGEVTFYLDPVSSVTSSLFSENGLHQGEQIKVTVPAMSPNTMLGGLKEVDLMKVDIEGAEYMMFESVSREQLRKVKRILIEFHHNTDGRILGLIKNLAMKGFKYEYLDWGNYHNPDKLKNEMGIIYATRLD
jgi:FkbM family methyltransferase